MPLTKTEQETFEEMFWEICDRKCSNNKAKLNALADLICALTGNVNLTMWLKRLRVK